MNWFVVAVALLQAGAAVVYATQNRLALATVWAAYAVAAVALGIAGVAD